jgi:Ca2+-binding EF-hand superfamily protein
LEEVFEKYDVNGDGFLSRNEIEKMLVKMKGSQRQGSIRNELGRYAENLLD